MVKVANSWLCPTGYALRDVWNALQRQNGTSLMRSKPPSAEEKQAWKEYDTHIFSCKECKE